MVVYEFEMVDRFLQNSIYFDIPAKYMLLAQIYCLSMFALKIILKTLQKTDLKHSYVEKVIVGSNGKNAMTFASVIGTKLLNNENIDPFLTNDIEKERTNIIQNTDEDKDEKWTFCDELKDYMLQEIKSF